MQNRRSHTARRPYCLFMKALALQHYTSLHSRLLPQTWRTNWQSQIIWTSLPSISLEYFTDEFTLDLLPIWCIISRHKGAWQPQSLKTKTCDFTQIFYPLFTPDLGHYFRVSGMQTTRHFKQKPAISITYCTNDFTLDLLTIWCIILDRLKCDLLAIVLVILLAIVLTIFPF